MALYSRRILMPLLAVLLLMQFGCASKIKGWSQEAYRTPEPLVAELRQGKLGVLPVMVLEQPAKEDQKRGSKPLPAPYTPDEVFETGEMLPQSTGADPNRLVISEILLRKLRANLFSIPIISPAECLKSINDSGLTAAYLRFDRNYPKLGVNSEYLSSFSRATGSRYLLISTASFSEYSSETSVNVIWTFGRKTVLRSVKILGQIWDAQSGRKLWEGYAVGYNSIAPYESPPLPEAIMDQAVTSFVGIMLPGPENRDKR